MASKAIALSCVVVLVISARTIAQDRNNTANVVPSPQVPEAPTGFDNKSNGVTDDQTHQADQTKFDEVEG